MPDRQAFAAIVYILRTGIQWNALPRERGASSTVHDRLQEWEAAGGGGALWQAGLTEYDELSGIEWEWQAADGAMTKAPFGGAATGANPTDRGKRGVERSLRVDGVGIPLSMVVDGANRRDSKLLAVTLDRLIVARPEGNHHLCLDAGGTGPAVEKIVTARGYTAHMRPRGEARWDHTRMDRPADG